MKRVDVEARVSQIAWPAPSADLRARIISAVVAAVPPISWSDRVWFSRAWRLAAVAVVLVAGATEYLSGPTGSSTVTASEHMTAEARFVDETARQAGLSSEQAAALARRTAAAENGGRRGAGLGGITLDDLDSGGEPR
jgi:hypothetical protein